MQREQAKAIIEKLVERFAEHRKDYHLADYNEQKARQDFINPFFKALGWDIDNEKGDSEAYREVIYEDKVVVKGKTKAPDYGFRLTGSGEKRLFYVEAKKPSVAIKINKESAYQLRRYGSSAQAHVSILTNFEDFIVYDCSKVPNLNDSATVARLKHIGFEDYVKEFDFLYDTFSHGAVTKGRFDKYVQASANKKGTDTLDKRFVESLDQWRKYLATSIALNNKKINDDELNFAVQQTIDRLIFLRFCEDRSVEPYGQLQVAASKGDAYKNLLNLFQQADDKYNSGLFDFEKDKITLTLKVDNKVIKTVVEELYYPLCNFEFSVMPVEILGNAYEQFLGKVIRITPARGVKIEEKPEVRKAGGVYYTPQYIVDYIVKNTVGKLINGKAPKDIEAIKIVDPACGSGSFLVGAYQFLLSYHLNYYYKEQKRLSTIIDHKDTAVKEKKEAVKLRTDLPLTPDGKLTTTIKKQILVNNIYGVDLDANATEVSKLSLLLKCMEGETAASIKTITLNLNDRVLPNLEDNIKDGNSLIDTDIYDTEIDFGEKKKIKPFSWKKQFPQVFKQGGFDVVVGNPPYEVLIGKEEKRDKEYLNLQVNYIQEKYATIEGEINLFKVFTEISLNKLLKQNGYFGFIMPTSVLNDKSTKKLRGYIVNNFEYFEINEFPEKAKVFNNVTQAVCVYIISNKESKIKIRTNLLEASDLKNCSFVNLLKSDIKTTLKFPKVKTQNEYDLFLKLSSNKRFKDYQANIFFIEGEIHLTKFKEAITSLKTKNTIRLIRGDVVSSYFISNSSSKDSFIDFNKVFSISSSPKLKDKDIKRLVYQQVVNMQKNKRLNFALVPENVFLGNTCGYLKITDGNILFYLGLLNSILLNWRYKITSTNNHILTNELYDLPFVIPNNNVQNEIIKHVEILLKLNEEIKAEKLQNKIEQIKQRIEHSEDKINQLVYELYQLTPEEITIIEGGANE